MLHDFNSNYFSRYEHNYKKSFVLCRVQLEWDLADVSSVLPVRGDAKWNDLTSDVFRSGRTRNF